MSTIFCCLITWEINTILLKGLMLWISFNIKSFKNKKILKLNSFISRNNGKSFRNKKRLGQVKRFKEYLLLYPIGKVWSIKEPRYLSKSKNQKMKRKNNIIMLNKSSKLPLKKYTSTIKVKSILWVSIITEVYCQVVVETDA